MFILLVKITSKSPTTGEAQPKSWERFLTLFLEEFSTEDHQNTIAKLYLSRQKKCGAMQGQRGTFGFHEQGESTRLKILIP